MKNLLPVLLAAWLGSVAAAGVSHAGERLTVIELFTSQNCPKCPPANRLLSALAEQDDILALSWSVDYWDNPKWTDTYGSRAHSERQAAYNKSLGRNSLYTPQLIIGGYYEAVGSDEAEVRRAIEAGRRMNTIDIAITPDREAGHFKIAIGETKTEHALVTRAIWYRGGDTVTIARGNNGGRSIHYRNIVLASRELETWRGRPHSLILSMAEAPAGADRVAVIVQEKESGPIMGAAWSSAPAVNVHRTARQKDS